MLHRIAVLTLMCLAAALVLSPAASGAGPETFKIDASAFSESESDFASDACRFPVEAAVRGHIVVSIFPDDARPIREIDRYSIRTRYTNPATEDTYRLVDAGPDLFKNGTVAVIGRSITGSGVIGRVVFDTETGEILFEAGHRVNVGDGAYVDAVCDALAA
jgi:hypothetical protein